MVSRAVHQAKLRAEGLVVVPDGQTLGVRVPNEPGLLHSHHVHRPGHDQILVWTVDVIVHRANGHGSRAGLLSRWDRQHRADLGEVTGCRRRPDRRRRYRHLDRLSHLVLGYLRVQPRRHRALTTVLRDAGRGNLQRHPGYGLVLENVPVAVLADPIPVYAGYRRDVEDDPSVEERPVVLVVRGRKRDITRAAHLAGGYGQCAVGAQRVIVGPHRVVHVRFVNTDRYRHVFGQRLAQVRDDLAGLALDHMCRHRRDRQPRTGGIVIEGVDEDGVVESHEGVVSRRDEPHQD